MNRCPYLNCRFSPIIELDSHRPLGFALVIGEKERSDFVYLTHGTELLHMLHIVLGIQSFSATPYSSQWFLWPLYPLAALLMGLFWAFGQPFAADKYRLPATSTQGETWVMPRYNFQVRH